MNREFVLVDEVVVRTVTDAIAKHWRRMAETAHPLVVIITELNAQRSLAQNRRLYAIEREIARNAWVLDLAGKLRQHREEAWHEHFLETFAPFSDQPSVTGKPRRKRTHEMTVGELSEYMNSIESFASLELGVEFSYG